jgi:hypothetical protein
MTFDNDGHSIDTQKTAIQGIDWKHLAAEGRSKVLLQKFVDVTVPRTLSTRGLRVGFLPGKRSAPIIPDRFLARPVVRMPQNNGPWGAMTEQALLETRS